MALKERTDHFEQDDPIERIINALVHLYSSKETQFRDLTSCCIDDVLEHVL